MKHLIPVSLVLTGGFLLLDAISVGVNTGVDLGIEFTCGAIIVAFGIYFSFPSYSDKSANSK